MKPAHMKVIAAMKLNSEGRVFQGQGIKFATILAMQAAGLCAVTWAEHSTTTRASFGYRTRTRPEWTATITDAGRVAT